MRPRLSRKCITGKQAVCQPYSGQATCGDLSILRAASRFLPCGLLCCTLSYGSTVLTVISIVQLFLLLLTNLTHKGSLDRNAAVNAILAHNRVTDINTTTPEIANIAASLGRTSVLSMYMKFNNTRRLR